MRVTPQSREGSQLDPKARYRNFVRLAAERQQVWGLFLDGWALSRDERGDTAFPLWSERESAERCAKGPWQGYEAAEIPLDDLIEQLLPRLAQDGLNARLCPSSDDAGLLPPLAQLILDLEHERDPSGNEDGA